MTQPISIQPNIVQSGIRNFQQKNPASFSHKDESNNDLKEAKKTIYTLFGIIACGFGVFGLFQLRAYSKFSKNMQTILKEVGTEEHNKFKNYLQQFKIGDKLTLSEFATKNLSEYKKNPTKVKQSIKEKGDYITRMKEYSDELDKIEKQKNKDDDIVIIGDSDDEFGN